MRTDVIPKGQYCGKCPYYQQLLMNHRIHIPYCLYLKKGSIPNGWTVYDYDEVSLTFGLEDKFDLDNLDFFDAHLLWDRCKECGINLDDEED